MGRNREIIKPPLTLVALATALALSIGTIRARSADDAGAVRTETQTLVDTTEAEGAEEFDAPLEGPLLLVFTYGFGEGCRSCDAIADDLERLEEYYPIMEIVRGTPRSRVAEADWGIEAFPSFVLIEGTPNGIEVVDEWEGSANFRRKVERAFDEIDYDVPRRPLPPRKREPRVPKPPKVRPPRDDAPPPRPRPVKRWYNPFSWFE